MKLERGLVFMSDTRTNAGVDNVSKFRKLFTWSKPGERSLVLMTAGNLATTQAVVSILEERTKAPSERRPSILELPTMVQIARPAAMIDVGNIAARAKGPIAHGIDQHQRHARVIAPGIQRILDRQTHRIAQRIQSGGAGQRDPPGLAFDADLDFV
jgi:predicted proteasome-type protease